MLLLNFFFFFCGPCDLGVVAKNYCFFINFPKIRLVKRSDVPKIKHLRVKLDRKLKWTPHMSTKF